MARKPTTSALPLNLNFKVLFFVFLATIIALRLLAVRGGTKFDSSIRRAAFSFLRSGSTRIQGPIPGARFATPAAAASFLSYFSCMCRNGTWQKNNTPRFLPWPVPSPALEICDVRHIQNNQTGKRNVAWREADDVVRNGGKESDWLVRPSLKYEWVVNPSACMTAAVAAAGNANSTADNSSADARLGNAHPFQPAWEAVNPDALIDRLAGKELLIVGDSISTHIFFSLRNFLLQGCCGSFVTDMTAARPAQQKSRCDDVSPYPAFCQPKAQQLGEAQDLTMCAQVACEGGFTVTALRSDGLSLESKWGFNRKKEVNVPWMEYVRRHGDRIAAVLMNRGAHYVEDERLLPEVRGRLLSVQRTVWACERAGGWVGCVWR